MHMLKKYKVFLLVFINFSLINTVLAIDESPVYFSKNPLAPERINKKCDLYVKEHVASIYTAMDDIQSVYYKKEWEQLDYLLKKSELDAFISKLRWCVGVFEFKGQRDYFYYAHKDLFLLQVIYSDAVETKELFNADVAEITKGVKKDLDKIKVARRHKIKDGRERPKVEGNSPI